MKRRMNNKRITRRKVQKTIKKDETKKLGSMVTPVHIFYVCNTTNRLKCKKRKIKRRRIREEYEE
jgi:hypothetical protein